MPRNKFSSPTLDLEIPPDAYQHARLSASGSCLISDAIKRQYPHLTHISTDMATIRASDKRKGVRYTYLAPEDAQMCLLAFDQGWSNPVDHIVLRRAVKIDPITSARPDAPHSVALAKEVAARRAAAASKQARGEDLTRGEKMSLSFAAKAKTRSPQQRPTARGAPEAMTRGAGEAGGAVVRGGSPIKQGPAHPNLLRGRNRHFGAKLAKGGSAWEEAVREAARVMVAEQEPQAPEPAARRRGRPRKQVQAAAANR
jgi:hypothetical protein